MDKKTKEKLRRLYVICSAEVHCVTCGQVFTNIKALDSHEQLCAGMGFTFAARPKNLARSVVYKRWLAKVQAAQNG